MAQEEKTVVTKEGYQELVNELDHMLHEVRQDVIRELQEARAQGDLSENADYDAARERQARVEARIRDLESMIANAQIIDEKDSKKSKKTVKLGSTVKILDMESNTEEVYTIVGSVEADPLNGKLSNLTPLAIALLDSKVGDTPTVTQIEEPYKVKILEIK
ncbi:transcription elongation factor GreA [uncultured Traorella sp.]|uniref:transcription elongation factor GreA n=1 Tax=uncultured Traorella sp. TaxID=1929048 RepID=UPI0025D4CC24|nr:transcription elongation factor GreA [uncultured Traorella sp.]